MEKIRICMIKVNELVEYAASVNHRAVNEVKEIVPITLEKAINQSKNPFAEVDDYALVLAYDGETCVGYLGMMPNHLVHNGVNHKFYWLTTWLIDSNYRSKGVGSQLMNSVKDLGVPFGAIHALDGAYKHLGYFTVKPLPFYSLSFSKYDDFINQRVLRGKVKIPYTRNLFIKLYRGLKRRTNFTLEPTKQISYPTEKYLKTRIGFGRSIECVNNMLEYPWVSQGESSSNYYFSDKREIFAYEAFHVYNKLKEKVGFVVWMLSKEKGVSFIKICDLEFQGTSAGIFILESAIDRSIEMKMGRVVVPKELYSTEVSTFNKLLYSQDEKHYVFFSEGNKEIFKDEGILNFFDCDQNYY